MKRKRPRCSSPTSGSATVFLHKSAKTARGPGRVHDRLQRIDHLRVLQGSTVGHAKPARER